MMDTIVSWLYAALGNVLEWVVDSFLGALDISLKEFVILFPAVKTAYNMFRVIGVGLVVILAFIQLFKFFAGSLAEVKDTPVRIGIRSAIAVFMIYFGGYFIEWIVDLAKTPYSAFLGQNTNGLFSFHGSVGSFLTEVVAGTAAGVAGVTPLSVTGQLVASLFLGVIIGWNIIKLMIEVAERFLMVGVLAYIAPLPFATICTQNTSIIFQKYLQMFAGQCVLMTVSVWSLNLILSAFGAFGESDLIWPIALLLILAMCRIAQRMDSYMQQLGIGVGTTGGSLLDELLNMTRTYASLRHGFGGHGGEGGGRSGSRDSVLGATSDGAGGVKPTQMGLLGALRGGFANASQSIGTAKREAAQAKAKGDSGLSAFGKGSKTVGKSFGEGAKEGSGYSGEDGLKKVAAASLFGAKGYNMMNNRLNSQKPVTKEEAGGFLKNGEGKTILNQKASDNGLKLNKNGAIEAKNSAAGGNLVAANFGDASASEAIQQTAMTGDSSIMEDAFFRTNNSLAYDENAHSATKGDWDKNGSAGMDAIFGGAMDDLNNKPESKMSLAEKNVSAVGDAMRASTQGDMTHGSLSDFNTTATKEGGHIASATVNNALGKQVGQFHVADQTAYNHMTSGEREGFVPIQSANGVTYFAKATTGIQNGEIPQGSGDGALNLGLGGSGSYINWNNDGPEGSFTLHGGASIETAANGSSYISGSSDDVVGAATGEAMTAMCASANRVAEKTIQQDSFGQGAAIATLASMESNGAGISSAAIEDRDERAAVSSSIATLADKAYGGEAIQKSFVQAASSGGIQLSESESSHFTEALTHATKGDTQGAFTVTKLETVGGTIKGTYNTDANKSYDFSIQKSDTPGTPQVVIHQSYDRHSQKGGQSSGGSFIPPAKESSSQGKASSNEPRVGAKTRGRFQKGSKK